jgi:hypothetical protein
MNTEILMMARNGGEHISLYQTKQLPRPKHSFCLASLNQGDAKPACSVPGRSCWEWPLKYMLGHLLVAEFRPW